MAEPTSLPVLQPGYHALAPGTVASVVTYLEMTRRPPPRPAPGGSPVARLEAIKDDPERYRAVFRRIGERWMWVSRLEMPATELAALLAGPDVAVFCVVAEGRDCGLLEIDFRVPGEAEIVFFGLVEDAVGRGLGRWLMEQAMETAWGRPVSRVWLHTCSLDHPAALPFYRRSGFAATRMEVEVIEDPRRTGVYGADRFPDLPPVG